MATKGFGLIIATPLIGIALLAASESQAWSTKKKRDIAEQQAALDQRCQEAREAILSVERGRLVEECVEKEWPRRDRAGCERFYADHGNATAGGRAPLYMNLPECVEAHQFRQNSARR